MAREELKWQNIDADNLPAAVKKSFDAMVEAEAAFKADLEKLLKAEGHMPEDKFLVMSRKGPYDPARTYRLMETNAAVSNRPLGEGSLSQYEKRAPHLDSLLAAIQGWLEQLLRVRPAIPLGRFALSKPPSGQE